MQKCKKNKCIRQTLIEPFFLTVFFWGTSRGFFFRHRCVTPLYGNNAIEREVNAKFKIKNEKVVHVVTDSSESMSFS